MDLKEQTIPISLAVIILLVLAVFLMNGSPPEENTDVNTTAADDADSADAPPATPASDSPESVNDSPEPQPDDLSEGSDEEEEKPTDNDSETINDTINDTDTSETPEAPDEEPPPEGSENDSEEGYEESEPSKVAETATSDSDPEIKENSVTFTHPAFSGLDKQDCFDGICLTRKDSGPVINVGGGVLQLGCGRCSSVEKWYDMMSQDFRLGCLGEGSRMLDIVNVPLCAKTDEGLWDLQFTSFSGGGPGGQFSYVRTPYVE